MSLTVNKNTESASGCLPFSHRALSRYTQDASTIKKSIVEMIIEASGKNIKIKNDLTKPTINTSLCLDCSLAKKELHWVPQYEIKLGIKSTVDWWEENINPRTLELLR